jgi:hypothetical protein
MHKPNYFIMIAHLLKAFFGGLKRSNSNTAQNEESIQRDQY